MTHRYIVIGSGGTGGWLIHGLSMMLEFGFPQSVLVVIDGDNFEPKNKERQSFTQMGNKAEVKVRELQPLFPNTFLVADNRWVVEAAEDREDSRQIAAKTLLQDGDVVYLAVDNFSVRKTVFDAAKEIDNIDIFSGGNDDALYGSTYHYQRRNGKDITEHPGERHAELLDPPDRNPGELSCQERAKLQGGTQLVATNMAVASWLLGRTQEVIFSEAEDKAGEIYFDLGIGLAQSYDRTETETNQLATKE